MSTIAQVPTIPTRLTCLAALLALIAPVRAQTIFSLDIGSDVCSDPNGGHGFDPGDMYFTSAIVLPGDDGFINDADLFGGLDPEPLYSTAVPFGIGSAAEYFDLDGFSWLPVNGATIGVGSQRVVWGGLTPALRKLLGATVPTLNTNRSLVISFDDDAPTRWSHPMYEVPVQSLSLNGRTYGTTKRQDETVSITLRASLTGYPDAIFAVADMYGLESEEDFDTDLTPNPDSTEKEDDDIDALFRGEIQGRFLFGADSEAHYGLRPGSIYEAELAGGGYAVSELVNSSTGLRLPVGTDLNDFEVAWIKHPVTGLKTLIAIFTVDEDDPTTPADESGGLDPAAIYGSVMYRQTCFKILDAPTVMYGLDRSTSGGTTDLYRVDRSTGAAVSLGEIDVVSGFYPQMGADADGNVWVIDGDTLIEVDVNNPSVPLDAFTVAGLASLQVTDITRHANSGFLYAVVQDSPEYELYEINIGSASAGPAVATVPSSVWGIAFDPDRGMLGTLYMVDLSGELYEFDPVTGSTSPLGCAGACSSVPTSLTLDTDGTMFCGNTDLLRIDPRTSPPTFTTIGSTGGATLSALTIVRAADHIDAIAIPWP